MRTSHSRANKIVAQFDDGATAVFRWSDRALLVERAFEGMPPLLLDYCARPEIGNPVEFAVREFAEQRGTRIIGPVHDPFQDELYDPSVIY